MLSANIMSIIYVQYMLSVNANHIRLFLLQVGYVNFFYHPEVDV